MKKYLIVFFLFFFPLFVIAEEKNTVNIYFFHSNTCSHCKAEEKFLKKLEERYDYVRVYRYEVHAEESQEYISMLEEEYQMSLTSVPVTIVGNQAVFGYQEEKTDREIMQYISYFSSYYYQDKLGSKFHIKTLPTYQFKKDNPSIEIYLEKNNDKILGFIPVKNLDYYTSASLLGFLGGSNIYYLFSVFLLFLLVWKYLEEKEGRRAILFYLSSLFVLEFSLLFSNFLSIMIIGFILFAFCFFLFKKNWKDLRKCFLYFIILIMSFLIILLKSENKNLLIFKNIDVIYQLLGMQRVLYYGCYLFSLVLVYCFSCCLFLLCLEKYFQKGVKK